MRWSRLVSTLVVLVVLFLLIGWFCDMLTPEPRRSACLGNLKQLGLGMKQYAQDFDGRYPWCVGATDPHEAWRDLGMFYPNYITGLGSFICPKSRDRKLKDLSIPDDKRPLEPFPADRLISYSYSIDARGTPVTAWTENAPATLRLAADKKAGTPVGSQGNPAKLANHKGKGRNVLYQDGHVEWEAGGDALDPDEDHDAVGVPDADAYRRWWSDPPYHGEPSKEQER